MPPVSGAGRVSRRMRVDQSLRAVGAVEVPVLVYLRISCHHVTDILGS